MAKAVDVEGLECEDYFLSGVRLVLGTRLAEMCALRNSAVDWSDIEGVHDMRVASRRLRSAVSDFSTFIRKRDLRPLRNGIKHVADALGAVRDDDVAIVALEKLSKTAPESIVAGIEQLIDARRQQREVHRRALLEVIAPDALARMQAKWQVALSNLSASSRSRRNSDAPNGVFEVMTFRRAAHLITLARWRELERKSASLTQPFKTGPLHEMRIAAKKLRYALELFANCLGETLGAFAKEIAEMQSSLGELHDCDVWIAGFGNSLRAHPGRGKSVNPPLPLTEVQQINRSTAVWLMRHFTNERTKHYRAAFARWHKWETSEFAAHLIVEITSKKSMAATKARTNEPDVINLSELVSST